MALTWAADYSTLADSYGVGFTNVQYQQDGGTIQNDADGIPGANHSLLGRSLYCELAPNETRREATPPNDLNSFGEGADRYFRFDFVLDTNYELNTTTWFHIISQIHSASGTASPVIEFDVRDGGLYIRGASETQTSVYNTRLVTLELGVKYSVIFRVKFSTVAANSLIQVWVDGTQVYDQVPSIGMLNGGGNSYWKGAGVYRSSSFDSTEGCWQSNHAFGTTYADVANLQNGNTGSSASMGLLGTLTEDWSSGTVDKTTKWSATYDPPGQNMPAAVVGGRCRVYAVAGTHYAQIATPSAYTLASSQAAIEVPTVAAVTSGSTGEVWTALFLESGAAAAGTRVGIIYRADAGNLAFEVQTDYGDTAAVTVAYSATTHRWWRIRASTTTLWFETSADGSAWTVRRTATLPSYMVTADDVSLAFEAWRDTGATDYAEIDNVNLTPATTGTTTGSLVDTFSGGALDPGWTANGAALVSGGMHVNAHHTNGASVYSSAKSAGAYTFTGSQLLLEVPAMPRAAGTSVNAQIWVNDPNPTATVDRIGFEFVGEQNRLDLIGQSGANYAAIGTTASVTYDPIAHRWLRISHSGTSISWATSPDGLTWTSRRTLNDPPAWTTKDTLQVSIEAFRTSGTNDVLRVDNINAPPNALATTAPSGVDALQRRTLSELDTWKGWLTTNNARGWLGEFNGVTVFGQYGDTAQQAQWDALLEAYLTSADVKALSASVWASGREWGNGYPSGVHVGTAVGDPLTIAQENASSTIAGHPTRGSGDDMRWRGVNLSGWEQGVTINGGGTVRSGAGYTHTTADFAFLAANGIDSIRLPFAWERLQPTLSTALDTAALTTLDGMLTAARQYGIRVVLDLHNYGRYTQSGGTVVALGGTLTNAQLSDFWTRMSTWVRDDDARDQTVIGYDLMNEPHALTGGATTWETASQAALTAIRDGGDTRLILVGGYTFSSLTEWATWHPDGWITDSANNFMYEAHHYWDTQSVEGSRSGTYQQDDGAGGQEILTYATELAAADAGEESGEPTVTSAGSFAAFFGI